MSRALWILVCQSVMLGFVHTSPSVLYVWLCVGHMSVSLLYWPLWTYVCQSDMLGFVETCLLVRPLCKLFRLVCWALWTLDMSDFVSVFLSVYLHAHRSVSLIYFCGLCVWF